MNSNDFQLPRVGETWLELKKPAYRVGETPAKQRLWLVVRQLPPHREGCPSQMLLMQLESGGERRVNLQCFASKKHPWKRFA